VVQTGVQSVVQSVLCGAECGAGCGAGYTMPYSVHHGALKAWCFYMEHMKFLGYSPRGLPLERWSFVTSVRRGHPATTSCH
jgi:hypothetical protein